MERRWSKIVGGLIAPKHVCAIGPALWEFLVCVMLQAPDGSVNGGEPITLSKIGEYTGRTDKQTSRNLHRLHPYYLTLKRTAKGYVIRITKPKKWDISVRSQPDIGVRSLGSNGTEISDRNRTDVSVPIPYREVSKERRKSPPRAARLAGEF